ncbi:unnamed protein product, partial [Didymodactylos carnosus]
MATTQSHFLFNNQLYEQIDGLFMGSPLAAIMADIYMSHFEEVNMPQLIINGVHLWKRYVDDTFTFVENNNCVQKILHVLNSYHPNIQFTVETEQNNTLSFLDVKIIRIRTTITPSYQTTVYRKPTYSGLMTKSDSFVPFSYKKLALNTIIKRAIHICSNYVLLHNELEFIKVTALKNGYPCNFIEVQIGTQMSKLMNSSSSNVITPPQPNTDNKNKSKYLYCEIPYRGKTTQIFANKLKHLIQHQKPTKQLRIIQRPPK